jgi:hypothetical protein
MQMNQLPKVAIATVALGAALMMGSAGAAELTVDISGIGSFSKFGSSNNIVLEEQLAPNAIVTGVSWDINLTAFSPSLLSDMQLYFTDGAVTAGVILTPGFQNASSGTADLVGSDDLVAEGLSFAVGADGVLRLEFAESKNFRNLSPAGIWNSGTVTFDVSALPVPEPSSYAMMALGLAGLGFVAKRRKAC